MMSLDMFVFEIGTAPYQELQRREEWRFANSERLGARSKSQFVGPGNDTITLSGALYPGLIGSYSALDKLRAMAAKGEAYSLVSGRGEVMGQWCIKSLDTKHSIFLIDGVARKADFTLELGRFDG
jgi:phage protein U